MASVMVFLKVDDARRFGMRGIIRLRLVLGFEAGGGALLPVFIPEIAALPDAMTETGKGADGGGVISHHILRIMAGSARPT